MARLFSNRFVAFAILGLLSSVVLFHVLILGGIIPYEIVWGGRLKTRNQMLTFETTSIAINLLMITVVAVYAGIIKINVNPALLKGLLWAMAGLFLMNTVGNLFSQNELEKLIFTPLTFLLALFSIRLALTSQLPFTR